MDFFRYYLRLVLGIAILSAAFTVFNPAMVFANFQQGGGDITNVRTDKNVYLPTVPRVLVSFDIRNPEPFVRNYQLGIEIIGPSGGIVFERVSTQEGDIGRISLDPNETRTVTFAWEDKNDGTQGITRKSAAGIYTVIGALRDWEDFDLIIDEVTEEDGHTFEVQSRPFLEVSRDSLDFGSFQPGNTPERSFTVTNSGNGTLEWSVDRWPESWLELVSPTSSVTGQGTVVFRVREDPQISEPLVGSIRIVSNVGDSEIAVKGALSGSVGGRIDNIVAVGLTFRQGDVVKIEFDAENDGGVPLEYSLGVVFQGPDGSIAFDSLAQGEEFIISLQPGQRRVLTYDWRVPVLAAPGEYLGTVSMRYIHDSNLIFHDYFDETFIPTANRPLVSTSFRIQEGPLLSLSGDSWNFGTLQFGETPEARFDVTNTRAGTISWRVDSLPDWLELKSSTSPVVGSGTIVVAVRDSLAPGSYIGELLVTSNGGNGLISFTLDIQQPPTATPTLAPTSTPAPDTPTPLPATSTPEPTATSIPSTSTPEPTATRVPPTRTPVPTATSAPPTATSTVLPSPTIAATSTPPPPESAVAANQEAPEDEADSAGGCGSAQSNISPLTATANAMFLLAPIGLIAAARRLRTRR